MDVSNLSGTSVTSVFESPESASRHSTIMVFPTDHKRHLISTTKAEISRGSYSNTAHKNFSSSNGTSRTNSENLYQSNSRRALNDSNVRLARSRSSRCTFFVPHFIFTHLFSKLKTKQGLAVLGVAFNSGLDKELLRDLIYVFQGINGTIIKTVKDNMYEICTPVSHDARYYIIVFVERFKLPVKVILSF